MATFTGRSSPNGASEGGASATNSFTRAPRSFSRKSRIRSESAGSARGRVSRQRPSACSAAMVSSRVTISRPVTSFWSNASTVLSRNSATGRVASRRIDSPTTKTAGLSASRAYTHTPVGLLAPRRSPSDFPSLSFAVISAAGLSRPKSPSDFGAASISRSIRAVTTEVTVSSIGPRSPRPLTGSRICQPSPSRLSLTTPSGRLRSISVTSAGSTVNTRPLRPSVFSRSGPRRIS
jgi:hypothetical protein